jgi:predicted alpha/beta hydrolase family esterase
MRTGDIDILIVPGWSNSGPDHWQSRWQRNLRTARRVEQANWLTPDRESWVARIVEEVARAARPAVLVAHSLGVAAVLHAAPRLDLTRLAGAFLVAPSDLDSLASWPRDEDQDWSAIAGSFAPMPAVRIAFPARVIASSDDAFCSIERAQALGALWGADVSILANAGHINAASGHGPWPEGLLSFGLFLKSLDGPVAGTSH